MLHIDPPHLPGSVGPANAYQYKECVPEEETAKNAGTGSPARHVHGIPFLAGLSPSPSAFESLASGLPPIVLGAGKLPSWIDMYRILLEMEMSEAMRSVLFPESPPPGKNDPPQPPRSRISVHYDRQRARQIAERKAANIKSRNGKFD